MFVSDLPLNNDGVIDLELFVLNKDYRGPVDKEQLGSELISASKNRQMFQLSVSSFTVSLNQEINPADNIIMAKKSQFFKHSIISGVFKKVLYGYDQFAAYYCSHYRTAVFSNCCVCYNDSNTVTGYALVTILRTRCVKPRIDGIVFSYFEKKCFFIQNLIKWLNDRWTDPRIILPNHEEIEEEFNLLILLRRYEFDPSRPLNRDSKYPERADPKKYMKIDDDDYDSDISKTESPSASFVACACQLRDKCYMKGKDASESQHCCFSCKKKIFAICDEDAEHKDILVCRWCSLKPAAKSSPVPVFWNRSVYSPSSGYVTASAAADIAATTTAVDSDAALADVTASAAADIAATTTAGDSDAALADVTASAAADIAATTTAGDSDAALADVTASDADIAATTTAGDSDAALADVTASAAADIAATTTAGDSDAALADVTASAAADIAATTTAGDSDAALADVTASAC